MAKTASLTADDLIPAKVRPRAASRQRGVTASDEYVALQFRMPPDEVQQFRLYAVQNGMKYNEFLRHLLAHYENTQGRKKA